MLLTKYVYGCEINPKKTPFGLLNNQIRSDSVLNNAGWFNIAGERLGSGDLNMKDLENISKNLPPSEIFIALSEADSFWNIPNDLDKSSPGINYLVSKCTWYVGKTSDINLIIRIRDDIVEQQVLTKDNVSYKRIPRSILEKSFANLLKPKESKPKTVPVKTVLNPTMSGTITGKSKTSVIGSLTSLPISGNSLPISGFLPIKKISQPKKVATKNP